MVKNGKGVGFMKMFAKEKKVFLTMDVIIILTIIVFSIIAQLFTENKININVFLEILLVGIVISFFCERIKNRIMLHSFLEWQYFF